MSTVGNFGKVVGDLAAVLEGSPSGILRKLGEVLEVAGTYLEGVGAGVDAETVRTCDDLYTFGKFCAGALGSAFAMAATIAAITASPVATMFCVSVLKAWPIYGGSLALGATSLITLAGNKIGEEIFDKVYGAPKPCEDRHPESPITPDPTKVVSPLIIDLDGNGVQTSNLLTSNTFFDMNADGYKERTSWVDKDDGLLVLDRNSNGTIDNINELFGNETRDGFSVLREFDDNGDGVINSADEVFGELRVWQDINSDGISSANELKTLAEAGIISINANAQHVTETNNGNLVTHRSDVTKTDGSQAEILDVWFKNSPLETRIVLPDGFSYHPDAEKLPSIEGTGNVAELRFAMSVDADLRQLVYSLVLTANAMSGAELRSAVEGIFLKWAGADFVDPSSRGEFVDARHLAAIEAFFDFRFIQGSGLNSGTPNPAFNAAEVIEQHYSNLLDAFTGHIVAQLALSRLMIGNSTIADVDAAFAGPLGYIALNFQYDHYTNSLVSGAPLTSVIADLGAAIPSDKSEAIHFIDVIAAVLPALAVEYELGHAQFAMDLQQALVAIPDEALRQFALTRIQVQGSRLLTEGTSGADTIAPADQVYQGDLTKLSPVGDTLWGKQGNDTLSGGAGGDIYVFVPGDGHDVIDDKGPSYQWDTDPYGNSVNYGGEDQALLIGHSRGSAVLTRSGDDLRVDFSDDPSSSLLVKGQFSPDEIGAVETFIFSDGSLTNSQILTAFTLQPATNQDDAILGSNQSDTIEGLAGNDVIEGRRGADTYVYRLGDGNDTIWDRGDASGAVHADIVRFADIGSDTVSISRAGADILIGLSDGAVVTIKDGFGVDGKSVVETFEFADGVSKTTADLLIAVTGGLPLTATISGSAANDTIVGSSGNDVIDGGAGDDNIDLGAGTDAVLFGFGSGSDIVTSSRENRFSEANVVRLSVEADDCNFSRIADDLVIALVQAVTQPDGSVTLQSTGDILTIRNHFAGFATSIDRIEFSSGAAWEASTIESVAVGEAGTLRLHGVSLSELSFNRTSHDSSGFDTYGSNQIGSDLVVSAGGSVLATIKNQFFETNQYVPGTNTLYLLESGIERIVLDDGTILDRAAIIQYTPQLGTASADITLRGTHYNDTIQGGAGNDYIIGFDGNDTIMGGLGDDQLDGDQPDLTDATTGAAPKQGSDTYLYASGDGNDLIIDGGVGAIDNDRLVLTDLNASDVWFERVRTASNSLRDDRLAIHVAPTNETIIVENQFRNGLYGLEEIRFADGTTIGRQQLLEMTITYGSASDENISVIGKADGKAGDDYISGVGANDTLIFGVGSGNDTIYNVENISFSALNSSAISVSVDDRDILFTIISTGETVRAEIQLEPDWWYLEFPDTPFEGSLHAVKFADGEVWDRDRILSEAAIKGTSDDDVLYGSTRDDRIEGGAGNDEVSGNDGNDTIIGGADNDTLYGEWGDDVFVATSGDGDDVVDGGDDFDTYDASNVLTAITVDLDSGTATGTDVGSDELSNIESVRGGGGNDSISGGLGDDTLDGGRGADILAGSAGDDTLTGGAGADQIDGGDGVDTVSFRWTRSSVNIDLEAGYGLGGDAEGDIYANVENIEGSSYTDNLRGDSGDNRIEGGSGNDAIDGRDGADTLLGGRGTDTLLGGAGDDWIEGGEGQDALSGGSGEDRLDGGGLADTLNGGEGSDTYVWSSYSGNDIITDDVASTIDLDSLLLEQLNIADVTLLRARDNLIVRTEYGGQVEIRGQFADPAGQGIESIVFADGTSIDRAYINTNSTVVGNGVPIAFGDGGLVTAVDTAIVIQPSTLLSNDFDLEGDVLSITSVHDAINGTAELNSAGKVVFTPASGYFGSASFSYTISDGHGGASSATVSIEVDPPQSGALEAVADSMSLAEDQNANVNVLANDLNPNGGSLSVTSASATNGTVAVNPDGTVSYIGNANFNGTDTIVYTIANSGGETATGSVSVTVAPVNDMPTAPPVQNLAIDEDASMAGAISASDVDGDQISYRIKAGSEPTKGTVELAADGSFTYQPNVNANGHDSFVVEFWSCACGIREATINVSIAAVNDTPIAVTDSSSTNEDSPVSYDVTSNDIDADGDMLSVISATASHGTVSISGGIVNYTPDANFNGNDIVTYQISDDSGGSATGTISVTINSVNDNPVATSDAGLSTNIDVPLTILASTLLSNDTDVDGDALTITSVGTAQGGTVALDGNGNIIFTPNNAYTGPASFTYTVSDGHGGTSIATASLIVNAFAGQTFAGTSGNDTLTGGGGNDVFTLVGNGGTDQIDGRGGYDKIRGSIYNDVINVTSGLANIVSIEEIDGGAGNDTIAGTTGDDVIDLSGIVLTSIENVDGKGGNDTIIGTNAVDVITGNTGNDLLQGRGGDDVFQVVGDGGTDTVDGGEGYDTIRGSIYNDVFRVTSGLANWTNIEAIDGGAGNDTIAGTTANDVISVAGIAITSIENIDGGAGDDTITGSAGADTITGGVGNDTLSGGLGDDTFSVVGDGGTDAADGGEGFDTIRGSIYNDVFRVTSGLANWTNIEAIDGGAGNDTIAGTTANDVINVAGIAITSIENIDGGAGDDTITGSSGADNITGGVGNDALSGGLGDDTFSVVGDGGTDAADGGEGFDTIRGSIYNDVFRVTSGLANWTNVEAIDGGAGNDTIAGTTSNDVINVAGIAITSIENIDGGAGDDTITGSAGADTITGGVGNDALSGGLGDDTFSVVGDGGTDTVDGGEGSDTIRGSIYNDVFRVTSGLANWTNVEAIDGGAGTADKIAATAGDDALDFSAITLVGIETIDLGAGNDRVKGTIGNESFIGGVGNDTFVFMTSFGTDTVSDFKGGAGIIDVLELSLGTAFDSYSEVMSAAEQIGTNTVITFDANTSITLLNVSKTTLIADDFRFV